MSWSAVHIHEFSMYAVDPGVKCISREAALQLGLTAPVSLGQSSDCSPLPLAPPTRM